MRLLVAEVDAIDPLCGQFPDLLVVPAIRAVDPVLSTTSSSPWISLAETRCKAEPDRPPEVVTMSTVGSVRRRETARCVRFSAGVTPPRSS
jgi:hypothetical protein